MTTYYYKARDQQAKSLEGTMVADSQNAVAVKLKQMGYIPVAIEVTGGDSGLNQVVFSFRPISFSDLNLFTRQLYTLQRAGLPILASLNALSAQAVNQAFKDIIEKMRRDIEGGATLSLSMEKHPSVFNALYTNMIRTGEVSGRMVEILERLTTLGEHEEKIRRRMQSALRYPLIVVTAIVIAFCVLITVVLPKYAQLYSQFNTVLPLPTRILLGIHTVVSQFWWLMLLAAAGLIVFLRNLLKTERGTWLWDSLRLKLPVLGPLFLKLHLSRFCRVTGLMMKSGVPILQILDLAEKSAGNAPVAKAVNSIKLSVNEGKGMLEPMKASRLFPPVVIQMVAVGEDTGKVDELLVHVADYYDSDIDYTLANLVTLIEPILIVVLGTAILFMALGIFLPMWNLMDVFKK
ncbi:MAG: hypothetical protein A2787_09150 [Omnitrophica WOR_2 bacterium RIFCSPHIGHO2_01_FULL_48_9]|uniref:Type II secretion system protein GspF domain-containing protein n=1 Tax=Candidatus Sungbacteria bacterium RIFCSPHIGHO2_02_FULL_47_11 TaxID=1802270 RepID=A0A1G2KLA7_9BACT|nr:MAG: hypothetical protein A2787_09150 [Omnitrophica WOR_2 bacterium RIFCSPHIGHO2_01_FULL_48_9]OHA00044.1 MAG: hypothetical protein A3C07_04165 [Candidatus Sungbacteria bacterium RIFCSPHIGHO2_02_FULL_47_11]